MPAQLKNGLGLACLIEIHPGISLEMKRPALACRRMLDTVGPRTAIVVTEEPAARDERQLAGSMVGQQHRPAVGSGNLDKSAPRVAIIATEGNHRLGRFALGTALQCQFAVVHTHETKRHGHFCGGMPNRLDLCRTRNPTSTTVSLQHVVFEPTRAFHRRRRCRRRPNHRIDAARRQVLDPSLRIRQAATTEIVMEQQSV